MPKKTVKFTEEELNNLKTLQQEYVDVQNNFGGLKIRQMHFQRQLESIDDQILQLEVGLTQLQNEEKTLYKSLEDKYGRGTLDLETGTFAKLSQ
jgi:septal ring factor EnvC (AmiA/AmiB activator)